LPRSPECLAVRAGVSRLAPRSEAEAALEPIDHGFSIVSHNSERCFEAELYRLKARDKMANRSSAEMTHAIIRGKNGRRYEVDFGDSPVRVEVHASEETVEIFVEADFETHAEERRRFAIMNIPRHLFSEAMGQAARRGAKKDRRTMSGPPAPPE
jgi:hypothetical protein